MVDTERAQRAKHKQLQGQVHRLAAEVKKLRADLRIATIALTSREQQLAFFKRRARAVAP